MSAGFAALRDDRVGAGALGRERIGEILHHDHHVDVAVPAASHGVPRRQTETDAPYRHAFLENDVDRFADRIGALWRRRV